MIDTHAHLTSRFGVSHNVDIRAVILAASDVQDSRENVKLARQNPGKYFAAVGVHPLTEISDTRSQMKELEGLIGGEVVAVGECGLDFSQDYNLARQMELFEAQIELAKKHNLPLIIHARQAVDEVIAVLNKHGAMRGVFHCYTGGKKRIRRILDLGEWYFGIDGNMTYEFGLEEVVKNIPKDRLLLETDSPELAPLPYRGQPNQPNYIKYIYQKVSQIWGEDCEAMIDGNACRLFQIVL